MPLYLFKGCSDMTCCFIQSKQRSLGSVPLSLINEVLKVLAQPEAFPMPLSLHGCHQPSSPLFPSPCLCPVHVLVVVLVVLRMEGALSMVLDSVHLARSVCRDPVRGLCGAAATLGYFTGGCPEQRGSHHQTEITQRKRERETVRESRRGLRT